jgi:hypothetical protein
MVAFRMPRTGFRVLRLLALLTVSAIVAGSAHAQTSPGIPGDNAETAWRVRSLEYTSETTTCGMVDDFHNGAENAWVCGDLPYSYSGTDTYYDIALGDGNSVAFTLESQGAGDLALFLVKKDTGACIATSVDVIGTGGYERISQRSYDKGLYYLIVDSASGSNPCGAYKLTIAGNLGGSVCGNGVVETGEVCDGGDCCAADCTFKDSASVCRPAAGECDLAETCSGTSADCPSDTFNSGNVCRASEGVCDLTETCDGLGPDCPTNAVADNLTLCRDITGVCDAPELCDGVNVACPADLLDAASLCRPSTGACDLAETCNGASQDCPADAFDSTSVCRLSTGACDLAETCNGASQDCPADAFDSTTVCRPSTGACDLAETCDGASQDCPADVFESSATICEASTLCRAVGNCAGSSAACVAGAAVDCDDGDSSTVDSCDPGVGCVHTPVQENADAGVGDGGADGGADADAEDASGLGNDAGEGEDARLDSQRDTRLGGNNGGGGGGIIGQGGNAGNSASGGSSSVQSGAGGNGGQAGGSINTVAGLGGNTIIGSLGGAGGAGATGIGGASSGDTGGNTGATGGTTEPSSTGTGLASNDAGALGGSGGSSGLAWADAAVRSDGSRTGGPDGNAGGDLAGADGGPVTAALDARGDAQDAASSTTKKGSGGCSCNLGNPGGRSGGLTLLALILGTLIAGGRRRQPRHSSGCSGTASAPRRRPSR